MLQNTCSSARRRSGIVLLVVMAMLALFATVALSFVFYAEAEATAARFASQAQNQAQANVDPEALLSYFLGQLIYDTDNPYSAMRGHSLARNMYGYNPADYNVVPYNGVGRMRYPVTKPNLPPNIGTKNNMVLINYTDYSQADPTMPPRAPETYQAPPPVANGLYPPPVYVGGNVHWTYPDLNSMFLGAVNGDGEVLIPSFHRPWLGVTFNTTTDDPNWAKYMTLRPHPFYHNNFNPPDWDGGGDVKNLEWGRGLRNGAGGYFNNDSIWLDLGFPVLTAPNGKKYKPLFAPLIVDMDSKINLFVHGNSMITNNQNQPHFSHMGYGPWEVNLSSVLTQGINPNATPPIHEWTDLLTTKKISRYGPDGVPDGNVSLGPLTRPVPIPNATPASQYAASPSPYWSQIDFGGRLGASLTYPGNSGVNSKIQTYPSYPVNWSYGRNTTSDPNEVTNHAGGYSSLRRQGGDDRTALVSSHLEALYRYQGSGSLSFTSELLAALPTNLLPGTIPPYTSTTTPAQAAKIRWLSTLRSMDLDRPGLMPYTNSSPILGQGTNFTFANATSTYPTVSPPTQPPAATPPSPPTFPPPLATGEFAPSFRSNAYNRSIVSPPPAGQTAPYFQAQVRALLNRNLTPYPVPVVPTHPPTVEIPGLIDITSNQAQFDAATADRVNLALDIYNLLIRITGARDPNVVAGMAQGSLAYNTARWLAQLAVNIVDFIDEDDYMTTWKWYPNQGNTNQSPPPDWVFGTELPNLLINEVYAQLDNDASETGLRPTTPLSRPIATSYRLNTWIELHNPFRTQLAGEPVAVFPRDSGTAYIQFPSVAAGTGQPAITGQNIYQIVLSNNAAPVPGAASGALPASPPAAQQTFPPPPTTTPLQKPFNAVARFGSAAA